MDGVSVLTFIRTVFGVVSDLQGVLQDVFTRKVWDGQQRETQGQEASGKELMTPEAFEQLHKVLDDFKHWGIVDLSKLARLGDVNTAFGELLKLQQDNLSQIESYLTACDQKQRTSLGHLLALETGTTSSTGSTVRMGMEPQQVARGRDDSNELLHNWEGEQSELHMYKPLAEARSKIEKLIQVSKRLKHEKETLERRNEQLESQIALVEGQRSMENDANGVYSTSEADPTTLGTLLQNMKISVTTFTRTLMDDITPETKTKFAQAQHKEMAFAARKSDIKYVFQQWAIDLVLQGLWGSDSFSYRCLPVGAKTEQSQKLYFTAYKQLKSIEASLVPQKLQHSGCPHELCSHAGRPRCWWLDFSCFCNQKWEKLKQTEVVVSYSGSTTQLNEDFVALLTNVWLAYLLTLAFEQPAAMFKVSDGAQFVAANMEPTMLDGEETNPEDLRVSFMVIPGFRVGKSVIKSLVYISPSPATGESYDQESTPVAAAAFPNSSVPLNATAPDPEDDLLPPEKTKSSGLPYLTLKVYRRATSTAATSQILKQFRGGTGPQLPRITWNQDRLSTRKAVLELLVRIGALDSVNGTGIRKAASPPKEQGTWEILIIHNGKTLKNNEYVWFDVAKR